MGLFGRREQVDVNQVPLHTVQGDRQMVPEQNGERLGRLFRHCHDVLAADAFVTAWHPVVGPTLELPRLGLLLQEEVFRSDRRLLSHVAVRRALSYLQVNDDSLRLMFLACGIELDEQREEFRIAETSSSPSVQDANNAIGFALELSRLVGGAGSRKISEARREQLEASWGRTFPSDDEAGQWIAWVLTATIRCYTVGTMDNVFGRFDVPSAITDQGWYPDPVYTSGDRYWDGFDWTDRCRLPDGRRYEELERALP